MRSGKAFHTRAGDLPIAPAARKQLEQQTTSSRMLYASRIYLATVAKGAVTGLSPVADIGEDAILKVVFAGRAMEGTIGVLAGPGDYSSPRTLPIRIELASSPAGGKLVGKIENATHGVRDAKGTCIAPLKGKPGNPLVGGFTADIAIQRIPSMHGPFDDEMILVWNKDTSNMGADFYPSVATVLGGDDLPAEWTTLIHGTPSVGPTVILHRVTGGGGAC